MAKNSKRVAVVAGFRTPFLRSGTLFEKTTAVALGAVSPNDR
jgi:acetyl-CoA acetyltransferase